MCLAEAALEQQAMQLTMECPRHKLADAFADASRAGFRRSGELAYAIAPIIVKKVGRFIIYETSHDLYLLYAGTSVLVWFNTKRASRAAGQNYH